MVSKSFEEKTPNAGSHETTQRESQQAGLAYPVSKPGETQKKVRFSKESLKRAVFREKKPSLNVIQLKRKRSSKVPRTKSRIPSDVLRESQIQALRRAWDLNREVFPKNRETFSKERDYFFTKGKREKASPKEMPKKREETPAPKKQEETPATKKRNTASIGVDPIQPGMRNFIVDSGASFHLICKKLMTAQELETIRNAEVRIRLQTANGIVWVKQTAKVHVVELDVTVLAYILDGAPALLSLGRLCRENGYRYVWEETNPYLQKKGSDKNERIYCKPVNDVPLITSAKEKTSKKDSGSDQTESKNADPESKEAGGDSSKKTKEAGGDSCKKTSKRGREEETECGSQSKVRKRKRKQRKKSCQPCSSHNMFTHFPMDPNCEICRSCKLQRARCATMPHGKPDDLPKPTAFADAITADHAILNEDDQSRSQDRVALVIQDRFTNWLQAYASKTKNAHDTLKGFQKFLGPQTKAKHAYTDGSKEFEKALDEYEISHDTSTPHRPQTNGVAERAVRRVKEGTSCALTQSGWNEEWWAEAMACYCFLRNVHDIQSEGKTPFSLRFGEDFTGPIIPFGAEVTYKPITDKDKERLHKYGRKELNGIFVGYAQHAGGGWTGDLLLVDSEEIEDAESVSDIYIKRFKAQEVNPTKIADNFRFPLAQGDLRQPGAQPRTRRSRSRGKPLQEDSSEESEGSQKEEESDTGTSTENSEGESKQDGDDSDTVPETGEPDTWTLTPDVLIRHHVNPRTKLYVPEDRDCPVPVKYLDITRRTETDLDSAAEKSIQDYWYDSPSKSLSSPWTGRTVFDLLRPKPPDGFKWVEGRLTRVQTTTRPDNIWPEVWKSLSAKAKKKAIWEWDRECTRRDALRSKRGIHDIPNAEVDEYTKTLARAALKHSIPPAPAMPTVAYATNVQSEGKPLPRKHQPQIAEAGFVSDEWFAMVHTPVPISKALKMPKAKEAVDAEWKKLWNKKAWLVETVQPRAKVIERAMKQGKSVHFGELMDLCHEKHSELPIHMRSYKGRVVFRGDQVRDESGYYAVFSEQGTSASHLAAAKFLDAIARMPGCDGEDSDAVGAYTQVELDSMMKPGETSACVETWIRLPIHQQPKSWKGIEDPVCRLRLNLYGHPLAGLYWEKHCQKSIFGAGFEKVRGWECLYVHRQMKLFLSVYVDDFKMAGNKDNLNKMWKILQKTLDLEPPVPMNGNVYLGCTQKDMEPPEKEVQEKSELFDRLLSGKSTGKPVQGLSDDEPTRPTERGVGDTSKSNKSSKKKNKNPKVAVGKKNAAVRGYHYDMQGHAQQCVERYLELSGKSLSSLKPVATPCIDEHQIPAEDFEKKGELTAEAARIVLKALYLARMGRPDALWTVNTLAREVTKWSVACDKRLHRLICYLHFTKDWVQSCWVGDSPDKCVLALFTDASFAGDVRDSKSTTGVYLCLVGPSTFVPISWLCKKQGAVSHSSSEAEVIALDAAVRMEGIPSLSLWEEVVQVFSSPNGEKQSPPKAEESKKAKDLLSYLSDVDHVPCNIPMSSGKAKLVVLEDNDAVIKMTIKGRSPNMRHVSRTHRVDLDWLFERVRDDPGIGMKFVGTKEQIADLMTKGSFTGAQWKTLCHLANIGKSFQSEGKMNPSYKCYSESCKLNKDHCSQSKASHEKTSKKVFTGAAISAQSSGFCCTLLRACGETEKKVDETMRWQRGQQSAGGNPGRRTNADKWISNSIICGKAAASLLGDDNAKVLANKINVGRSKDVLEFVYTMLAKMKKEGHLQGTRLLDAANVLRKEMDKGEDAGKQLFKTTHTETTERRQKLYLITDSVLSMGTWGTKASERVKENLVMYTGDIFLDLEVFVIPGARLPDFLKQMKEIVDRDAGGDPGQLKGSVLIMTMLSDTCFPGTYTLKPAIDQESLSVAAAIGDLGAKMPQFTVMGPGSEENWRTPGFDKMAKILMDMIMMRSGKFCYSGSPIFSTMLHKNGERDAWHFNACPSNVEKMMLGILNWLKLDNFLHNLVNAWWSNERGENVQGEVQPDPNVDNVKYNVQADDKNVGSARNSTKRGETLAGYPTAKEKVIYCSELAGYSKTIENGDYFLSRPRTTNDAPCCIEYTDFYPGGVKLGNVKPSTFFGPVEQIAIVVIEGDPCIAVKVRSTNAAYKEKVWINVSRSAVQFGRLVVQGEQKECAKEYCDRVHMPPKAPGAPPQTSNVPKPPPPTSSSVPKPPPPPWTILPFKGMQQFGWYSKTASWLLRHRMNYREDGSVLVADFERAMWEELGRNREVHPWKNEEDLIRFIIFGCRGKPRFEIQGRTEKPIRIRAMQGHSRGEVQRDLYNTQPVTEADTTLLWHGTTMEAAKMILQNGIKPGRYIKKGGRLDAFFSMMAPGSPFKRNQDYYTTPGSGFVFNKAVMEPYPFDAEVTIAIDVKMARAAGCSFYQTRSFAVLTQEIVPPEAIRWIQSVRSKATLYSRREQEDGASEQPTTPPEAHARWADESAGGNPGTATGVPKEEAPPVDKTKVYYTAEQAHPGVERTDVHEDFDKVKQRISRHNERDWWRIFGVVRWESKRADVKSLYRQMTRPIHPDKSPGIDKDECTQLLDKLTMAMKYADKHFDTHGDYEEKKAQSQAGIAKAKGSAGKARGAPPMAKKAPPPRKTSSASSMQSEVAKAAPPKASSLAGRNPQEKPYTVKEEIVEPKDDQPPAEKKQKTSDDEPMPKASSAAAEVPVEEQGAEKKPEETQAPEGEEQVNDKEAPVEEEKPKDVQPEETPAGVETKTTVKEEMPQTPPSDPEDRPTIVRVDFAFPKPTRPCPEVKSEETLDEDDMPEAGRPVSFTPAYAPGEDTPAEELQVLETQIVVRDEREEQRDFDAADGLEQTCPRCSYKFSQGMIYCTNCGDQSNDNNMKEDRDKAQIDKIAETYREEQQLRCVLFTKVKVGGLRSKSGREKDAAWRKERKAINTHGYEGIWDRWKKDETFYYSMTVNGHDDASIWALQELAHYRRREIAMSQSELKAKFGLKVTSGQHGGGADTKKVSSLPGFKDRVVENRRAQRDAGGDPGWHEKNRAPDWKFQTDDPEGAKKLEEQMAEVARKDDPRWALRCFKGHEFHYKRFKRPLPTARCDYCKEQAPPYGEDPDTYWWAQCRECPVWSCEQCTYSRPEPKKRRTDPGNRGQWGYASEPQEEDSTSRSSKWKPGYSESKSSDWDKPQWKGSPDWSKSSSDWQSSSDWKDRSSKWNVDSNWKGSSSEWKNPSWKS